MLLKIFLAMIAFAANSVICRIALKENHIDAILFSNLRIISGAITLYLLMLLRPGSRKPEFNGLNAVLLFVYVITFSIAYVSLNTAAGALLLFGTVQLVMTGWGIIRGEKTTLKKSTGILFALIGIGILLLPGATPPPTFSAMMMTLSGIAWAAYCIAGKTVSDASSATTGNFILSVPAVILVSLFSYNSFQFDTTGILLAIIAGSVTSGCAYILWYSLLPQLSSTTSSTIQLSVPCLATLGGVIFLQEPLNLQISISSLIILSGIGLVIWSDKIEKK
ncbi:DMT family transporter [Citrobacter telavivensis]